MEDRRFTRAFADSLDVENRRLEQVYNDRKEQVEQLLAVDFRAVAASTSTIEENAECLRDIARRLKAAYKDFEKESRILSTSFAKDGRIDEAQETQQERSSLSKDIKEFVLGINSYLKQLGVDSVSNIDSCSSIGSLFSGWNASKIHVSQVDNAVGGSIPNSTPNNPIRLANVVDTPSTINDIPINVPSITSVHVPIACVPSITAGNASLAVEGSSVSFIIPPSVRPRVTVARISENDPFSLEPKRGLGANTTSVWSSGPYRKTLDSKLYTADWLKSLHESFPDSDNKKRVNFTGEASGMFPNRDLGDSSPFTRKPERSSRSRSFPSGAESAPFSQREGAYGLGRADTSGAHYGTDVTLFQSMSSHMLKQDIARKSIDPFDGTATSFWPWVGRLKSYTRDLNLTPLETIHLMESNSTGDPHATITSHVESLGEVSRSDVQDLWYLLETRFGSTQKITAELLKKVDRFPSIRGVDVGDQLCDMFSLCKVIQYHVPKCPELCSMNLGLGLRTLRGKLPEFLQNDWRKIGQRYEDEHGDSHPPFAVFVEFIKFKSRQLSNKNYDIVRDVGSARVSRNPRVMQTDVSKSKGGYCEYHERETHETAECNALRKLAFAERKHKVFEMRLCYRCLGKHLARDCKENPRCSICQGKHATVMHRDADDSRTRKNPERRDSDSSGDGSVSDGARKVLHTNSRHSGSNSNPTSSSFSKTLLVEFTMEGCEGKSLLGYCILDECASTTLLDEKVVEFFGRSFPTQKFKISFADRSETETYGRVVTGLKIRGVNEAEIVEVPEALTQPAIADTISEVATPAAVASMDHSAKFAGNFPQLREDTHVMILVGRDCGRALATQCMTPNVEPYVHRTPLGYALVGARPSPNRKRPSDRLVLETKVERLEPVKLWYTFEPKCGLATFDTFERRGDDDQPGMSIEDGKFLSQMTNEVQVTETGNLELPLPLKSSEFPDNRAAVFMRTKITMARLAREPQKLEGCIQSMQRSLDRGYVEQCEDCEAGYGWYLPIFCVVNPSKNKVRMVYDASAKYKGVSLNSELLQGPDLNNQLRSVLLGFREEPVAFGADVQDMFNNFRVPESQRDYLRFFWYQDNDPRKPLVAYRATSHIFGCISSPAVANFALKYCASNFSQAGYDSARDYIMRAFYVDDGLSSTDSAGKAVQILRDARTILDSYGVRLHKIMSNSAQVLNGFPESEWATDFNLLQNENTVQRALGVRWDCKTDEFVLNVNVCAKPFTKRGVLSVTNSLYDPVGFISPVVLQGRLLQREILSSRGTNTSLESFGWDDVLPIEYGGTWQAWLKSLEAAREVRVPRAFYPLGFLPVRRELHVYCDASDLAIGHVGYMRVVDGTGGMHIAFIAGSSRVAPKSATSIPRLELCAAMEAAKAVTNMIGDLRNKPDDVFMYSDSQIVLGYLNNDEKRFDKYIERRVAIVLDKTSRSDWYYVGTKENPADFASRPHTVEALVNSTWYTGPDALYIDSSPARWMKPKDLSLPGEKTSVMVLKTDVAPIETIFDGLFARIGCWQRLVGVAKVVLRAKDWLNRARRKLGSELDAPSQVAGDDGVEVLVRQVQRSAFDREIALLTKGKELPEGNPISDLSPFINERGLLCVGGRLRHSDLPQIAKNPCLLPPKHPLSVSLVAYVHQRSKHQGGHITHGALIQSGFHIVKGRVLVRDFVKNCVLCRKLRRGTETQLMADLPSERLECVAPFSNVGLDVFGPFFIHDGRQTRRTTGSKKIWALIFVCMPSRAVHIETLVGMDTASFRNALARFEAVRGRVEHFRSDQGSNFVAARRQLGELDVSELSDELRVTWRLNPAQASHHGGSWERKIGSVRRVLEASLALVSNRCLSRDEFATFLAEAAAVVNNTPLWTSPNHPDDPEPLTPAMLLTLRDNPNPAPREDFDEKDLLSYGERRYRRVQYLSDQFWSRWRKEYLHTLTQRHKWKTRKACIRAGDVVLLRDKQVPRNEWPMGRVVHVKTSLDGLVRSATVRLAPLSGSSKPRLAIRAISDMVLLFPSGVHAC